MSESFRTTPPEHQNSFRSEPPQGEGDSEVGKALLVGLLGGLVSAAGYFVYRRLPDEQKDRLHTQVRTMVAQRINELRQNFNI